MHRYASPYQHQTAAIEPQSAGLLDVEKIAEVLTMGLLIVMLGSVCGFFGGLSAWLFFDVSALMALTIWGLSGSASTLLLLRPRPSRGTTPDLARAA